MKKIYGLLVAVSVFFSSLLLFVPVVGAATTPSLGAATTFSALAHTFNNTTISSGTAFYGDLGYATSSGAGAVYVRDATHINDNTYTQAGADQHTALSALNSQPCTFTFGGAVDLATDISHGALGVYTPGVYCSPGAMSIGGGGTVSLDGAGTYIFRPTGALTTTDFSIATTTNGASACDVFWTPKMPTPFVATALGSETRFVGTVIEPTGAANSNITVGSGTKWVGRALAFDWTITTNPIIPKYITITAPTCPVLPPPEPVSATLHVVKHVVNNDGGTATSADFIMHVKGQDSFGINDVSGSPMPGVESPGTLYSLNPATYVVTEEVFLGYTSSYSGDCDWNGNVALNNNDNKTCTITNDDIPVYVPPENSTSTVDELHPATLHVIKHVINDNGGTSTASTFNMHVKGQDSFGINDIAGSPKTGAESPGTSYSLNPATYVVSEDLFSGYTSSFSGDCDVNGNVTLLAGDNKKCTITNDDIAKVVPPPSTKPAVLHVIKHVINDNGGTATASIFDIYVKSSGFFSTTNVAGSPAVGVEAPGTSYTLNAGTYIVSEGPSGGYSMSFSGDCDAYGKVKLSAGDDKTCVITNNDDVISTVIPKLPNTGIVSWFAGIWENVVSFFYPATEEKIKIIVLPPPTKTDKVTNTPKTGTAKTTIVGFPATLKIPKINIDTGFQYTGLKKDGAMDIPNNIVDVGWFKNSPRPGDKGTAVITGHLVQIRGGVVTKNGVFNDLNKLSAGDKVYVGDNRGATITFVVREIRRYDPDVDATDVFTSSDGDHLNIITCDGVWNETKKSYSKRLVVFTDREN